ncbi:hypothetical protein [Nocardioides kribbensis]|uniref:Uncharacterized protein n=1 Tax=Nocardioides kribbensis TaxID=305517 RepID=A0ABV1NTM4_9ACTN
MEILLWLAPAAVVAVLAMAWVAWVGREPREQVDREAALERMAGALARPDRAGYAAPAPERDRSTGIAVRPSRAPRGPAPSQRPGESRRAS